MQPLFYLLEGSVKVEGPTLSEGQSNFEYRVRGRDAPALDGLAGTGPVIGAEEGGSHVRILCVEDGTRERLELWSWARGEVD